MTDLVDAKQKQIIGEWNTNALYRHKQIISGNDISYDKVLLPTIYHLINDIDKKRIIDVGCGSGVLASKLALNGAIVTGLDPSKEIINIANKEYKSIKNLFFFCDTIENFSRKYTDTPFEIAVSNMSLITIPDYEKAIQCVSNLLKKNGIFVINITHPCFWNKYRKYEPLNKFNYIEPHEQRGRFIISLDKGGLGETTHFHRPIQNYFRALKKANFIIDELIEPYPSKADIRSYNLDWKIPHFLSLCCIKNS